MRRFPKGYSITRAAAEEIPTLVEIDVAAAMLFADTGLISDEGLLDHVPEDVIAAGIEAREVFLAREHHGHPIGFTLTSERGGTLYLDQISVHPDHGQQGVGSGLLKRVIEDAKDRKFKRLTLSTFRKVAWNAPFYRKAGFKEIKPAKLENWMIALQESMTQTDLSQRCFMQRKAGIF